MNVVSQEVRGNQIQVNKQREGEKVKGKAPREKREKRDMGWGGKQGQNGRHFGPKPPRKVD